MGPGVEESGKVIHKNVDGETVIVISGKVKQWQVFALCSWILLWMACGAVVMYFIPESDRNTALVLIVYLAFWLYFLYKSASALLWRLYGAEYIKLADGELWYKRDIKSYGKVHKYDLATMQKIGLIDYSKKPFAKIYSDAFWTVGGERIGFEYLGQKIILGMQMSQEEASRLVHTIQQASKDAKRGKSSWKM